MTALPLVSVLIPAYNHARYIEACLESIRHEGYPRLEVLVLDDGSQDQTCAVAESWGLAHGSAFERFVVRRRENRGITRTLNELVGLANGAFVVVVASDDMLLPGGIMARLEFLEQRPHLLAVFADARVCDDAGNVVLESAIRDLNGGHLERLTDSRWMRVELLLHWSVPGPVFLARKMTFDPVCGIGSYDESLAVEDLDMYLRLLSQNALGFLNQIVAMYRVHEVNFSRNVARRENVQIALIRSWRKSLCYFGGLDRLFVLLMYLKNLNHFYYAKAKGFGKIAGFIAKIVLYITFKVIDSIFNYVCRKD